MNQARDADEDQRHSLAFSISLLLAIPSGIGGAFLGMMIGSFLGRQYGDMQRWDDIVWAWYGFLLGGPSAFVLHITLTILCFGRMRRKSRSETMEDTSATDTRSR